MNAEILLKVLPKITYNTSVLPHIQSWGIRHIKVLWSIDQIFDCMNVLSVSEHFRKRKDIAAPNTAIDDEQFNWLFNVSLNYFDT